MKSYFKKTHPSDATVSLARAITWEGSKQTYFTTRLLVDTNLVDDCYRAYAYFRWADDVIDDSSRSSEERLSFINRQKMLIEQFYRGDRPDDLLPQEQMIADIISHDSGENQGLVSFIYNFVSILEFDTNRRDRFISQGELNRYSFCLAKAVTDGIQYFIGHKHTYPSTEHRYSAVFAAHVTHMLRDMVLDIKDGYINIPTELLQTQNITPEDIEDVKFRAWVRERVELARRYLYQGKQYLEGLDVLRCKVAGFWYCARYEDVLDAIERDDYVLKNEYKRGAFTLFRIAWIGVIVTLRHYARRIFLPRPSQRVFGRKTLHSSSDLVSEKPHKGVLKR